MWGKGRSHQADLVGNQDSLQRGLRLQVRHRIRQAPLPLLETRTRFKEDCDLRVGYDVISNRFIYVGNQDSLQRGLRPIRRLGVGMYLHVPTVGNQDSLQRGLRPKNFTPLRTRSLSWKPGLASKRIATITERHLPLVPFPLRWKPGLASKRIATLRRGYSLLVLLLVLETRTRFKEDCDLRLTLPSLIARNVTTLETRTRFKEDCDCGRHPNGEMPA